MKNEKYLHSELTSKILEAFYQVFNKVGFGFEKRVYVKSLAKALKNLELKNEMNKEVPIYQPEADKLIRAMRSVK